MSKIRFFEVAGRKAPLIPPGGGRIAPPQPSPKGRERLSFGQLRKRYYNLHSANIPSFGGAWGGLGLRGGLILVLTIALAGASLGVNAQDTQKFKIIKTDYGDMKGGSYYGIGELNGAVLNADTLSVFGPRWTIVNISNDTFSSDVRYDIIGVLFLYAEDASLLLEDTLGGPPMPISMEDFSPNDTVTVGMFWNFSTLTNYFKKERGIDLEQISYWEMIAGVRYTSKDGYYSDSVFYAGADTVTFRIVRGGVGIVETDNYPSLRVYPNPAKNGELRIENGELKENTVIEISDVAGRTLNNYQLSIVNSQLIIDISHLAAGMYFLKINNQVTKFIKK